MDDRLPKLADCDLGRKLSSEEYDRRLPDLQRQLAAIQQAYLLGGHAGVVILEGWDASGKGGAIRRISATLDPRGFKVWPIGAPAPHDRDRHFLARFMERLPPRGSIALFDRSWYGRVLVERVEGLTPAERWRAGYREINEFERMVVDDGARLVKLFLHISPEEQLARFEERLRNPLKRWKLSYEDFRNRARWQDYSSAIDEMFERTSTKDAPWRIISSNDKKHGRIAAMQAIVDALGNGIDLTPRRLDEAVLAEARKLFPPQALDAYARQEKAAGR